MKGGVTIEVDNDAKTRTKLIFKNNAPLQPCISKLNNRFIDNMQKILILLCQCIIG